MFTIFYSNSVIHGKTKEDWQTAPSYDVQYVIWWEWDGYTGWSNLPHDRTLWTGDDEYEVQPGWGVKYGAWMDTTEYRKLWAKVIAPKEEIYGVG